MQALILVSHGNQGVAELPDGREVQVHYRRGVGRPVCGDRVRLEEPSDHSTVVAAIEARKNQFARADARQRMQIVAANLDHVMVVVAPRPEPTRDLLERYLVAVHSLRIDPVIVVNKADLPEASRPPAESPLARLDEYAALGYRVVHTSCKTEPGVDRLAEMIAGRISILVGQSGVGKSSLVNRLVPDLDVQTGALSRATGKGRHTTTFTMMYSLPGGPRRGGYLVDSPGVWEYGLWDLASHELESGFIEFRPYLGNCRFNDCLHDSEPGCAVKAAVESGEIAPWRHAAYRRLLRQQ